MDKVLKIKIILFQYKNLIRLILLTICALMIGLLPENQQISWLMRYTSFYLIGALIVSWCIWLMIVIKGKLRQFFSQHFAAIITHYYTALEYKPAFSDAYCGIGAVMAGIGKPDMAIQAFKKALEIYPHSISAANNIRKIETFLENM